MPLYEYQCDACGHRFEVIQRFSDPPVGTCRVCGGPIHKLLSPAAIQFKGSGWYVTDYGRQGSSRRSENGGATSSTGPAKDASSSDASPASGTKPAESSTSKD
jgi:putative FmdB family regulatory protein